MRTCRLRFGSLVASNTHRHPSLHAKTGGAGERRTLAIVAELADGWNTACRGLASYEAKAAALRRHCIRLGRNPMTIRRSIHLALVIGESHSGLTAAVQASNADGYLAASQLAQVVGTPEECASQLAGYPGLGVTDVLVNARAHHDIESWHLVQERLRPLLSAMLANKTERESVK